MQRRKCGNIDLPLLGIGCWSFGGGKYWGDQDQNDVNSVVSRALDIGCNYFDTAEAYNDGTSESSLGEALKGKRSKAIIGTKISPSNTSPTKLREHCEASLKRLQTDYLDIYMIHWHIHLHSIEHFTNDESIINNPPTVEDAFDTLIKLQKEGKIKYIGVSNFGVGQLTEAINTGAEIAVNELPYNLLMRAIEAEILPFCKEKSIGILSYMPLLQGLLSGKYKTLDEIPMMRTRTRHFSGKLPNSRHGEDGEEELTFQTLKEIQAIADKNNVSMSHLALAWCAANADISCIISGARNLSQLEDNIEGVSLNLKKEVVDELNSATLPLLERLGNIPDYYENRSLSRSW